MTKLSIIVAIAKNNVIGIDNTLPWHLPEDLKRFRVLTMGHHIIMGRKTYESLGRLLPGRITVIVTRNQEYKVEGALVAHSLEAAISLCKNDDEIFLIGGAELYQDGLRLSDKLYITELELQVNGDAHFPQYPAEEWEPISRETHTSEQGINFSYVTYQRKLRRI